MKRMDLPQRHGEHREGFGGERVHPCGGGQYVQAAESRGEVGSEWWVVGNGGGLLRVDEEGAAEFGPGRGRPCGSVARVFLRSKGKVSEWRRAYYSLTERTAAADPRY